MKDYQLKIHSKQILADTLTPVSIYLSLRDRFHSTIMLESSDYHGNEHTYSYIAVQPIAGFKIENNVFHAQLPDQEYSHKVDHTNTVNSVDEFISKFESVSDQEYNFIHKGLLVT
jgi:anthranilate synthase component 1